MVETLIGCLPSAPRPGTESTTWVYALIRNRTVNFQCAHRMMRHPTQPHLLGRVVLFNFFSFSTFYLLIFREKGREGERGGEKQISCLSCPSPGTSTQRNETHGLGQAFYLFLSEGPCDPTASHLPAVNIRNIHTCRKFLVSLFEPN